MNKNDRYSMVLFLVLMSISSISFGMGGGVFTKAKSMVKGLALFGSGVYCGYNYALPYCMKELFGSELAPDSSQLIAQQLWDKANVPHSRRVPVRMMDYYTNYECRRLGVAAFAGPGGIWLSSDYAEDPFTIAHEQGHHELGHTCYIKNFFNNHVPEKCEEAADKYAAKIVELSALEKTMTRSFETCKKDPNLGRSGYGHASHCERYRYMKPILDARRSAEKNFFERSVDYCKDSFRRI